MPTPAQLLTLRTQIAPAAISAARLTGVPPEFLCAQCILESAWLTKLSGSHNCFGIKSYLGEWRRELVTTHEWFTDAECVAFLRRDSARTASLAAPAMQNGPRKYYVVKDWFAAFPTYSACFTRRAAMFAEGAYRAAWRAYQQQPDLEAFVRAVGPIYATAPNYVDQILKLARSPEVVEIVEQLQVALSGYDEANARNARG